MRVAWLSRFRGFPGIWIEERSRINRMVDQFFMEFVVSVDGIIVYERDLEVGMMGLVSKIKGCVPDLSKDFGLKGLNFCEIFARCLVEIQNSEILHLFDVSLRAGNLLLSGVIYCIAAFKSI